MKILAIVLAILTGLTAIVWLVPVVTWLFAGTACYVLIGEDFEARTGVLFGASVFLATCSARAWVEALMGSVKIKEKK